MEDIPIQEHLDESPSPQTPKNRIRWVSIIWAFVAILFVGNLVLVISSSLGAETDPSGSLRQRVEADKAAFDRLSFWQKLLRGEENDMPPLLTSHFDGLPIDPEYSESVVSVMIDNFVTARPQHTGIRAASVVYEALVEGGITRLMLVFPYQELDRVGPVRSARDYFVDFAEAHGGVYVHAGGSPSSLEKLWGSDRLLNLDEADADIQISGHSYSFRDLKYDAPHNLFFDLLMVREYADSLKWPHHANGDDWCFEEKTPEGGLPVSQLDLNFSNDVNSSYYAQFRYDEESRTYKRYYGKTSPSPHIDQGAGLQIAPRNIIVKIAPSTLIPGDEKERLSMSDIGSGTMQYYRDGRKWSGTWKKTSESQATQFRNEAGQALCLAPGQTWIAIVDDEGLMIEE